MRLFGKKKSIPPIVDLHSHLIPGIDDGFQSLEDVLEALRIFRSMGYEKIITTPHIHPKYPNTADRILQGLQSVNQIAAKYDIGVEVEAAAEYYVDENFLSMIENDEKLLSFGDRFVLVETSFLNKPLFFENLMFQLLSKGYRPVFAHPERYRYLEGQIDWLMELKEMGVEHIYNFYGTTKARY